MDSLFPDVAEAAVADTASSSYAGASWHPATHGAYRCASADDCREANAVRQYVEAQGSEGATLEELAEVLGMSFERAKAVANHLVDEDAVLTHAFAMRGHIRMGVLVAAKVPNLARKR